MKKRRLLTVRMVGACLMVTLPAEMVRDLGVEVGDPAVWEWREGESEAVIHLEKYAPEKKGGEKK